MRNTSSNGFGTDVKHFVSDLNSFSIITWGGWGSLVSRTAKYPPMYRFVTRDISRPPMTLVT